MNGEASSGTYPGNLTLPAEVREKIVSTFRHTLDLYRDGKLEDCLIGCDFILKMDPRFGPARKLQEKARNPKAEIDVADLQAMVFSAAAPPAPRETATVAAAPTTGATRAAAGPGASARRDTAPISQPDPEAFAIGGPAEPLGGGEEFGSGGLDDLSLDSLSLDGPLPDLKAHSGAEPALPFEASADAEFPGFAPGPPASDPVLASGAPSPQEEIAALVKKGDEARSSGNPQQAIEIWSRIFLIDINNGEAVGRIEETRREMAEEGRRVAASLARGQESFAKGDLAAARSEFDTALTLGENQLPSPPAVPIPAAAPPPAVTSSLPPHDLSQVAAPGDVLAEELEQSGPPGGRRSWTSISRPPRESAPAAEKPAPSVLKRFAVRIPPRLAAIGGVSLVVAAALLFFVLRPSGKQSPAQTSAENGPTLAHATRLFQEGKIEETTAELERIPPGHPDFERAQKLLASLVDPREPAAPPGAPPGAPSSREPASSANPAALRADAERALGEKRYIDAMKSFSQAAPHFEGDPTFSQEMAAASEKVSELTPAVKLYNDGEYETAIPILWRIYQAARDNQDARSYLMRSYYNQGILQLQNGLFDRAKESFGEVLALEPQDVEASRHREFAERYRTGELDLLGRIYVRYISPRP